jgi:hypothetical protein
MAKTYDITTPVGKVRLNCAEKDVTTTLYDDSEIQMKIDEADGDINLASAYLWDVKASLAAGKAVKKSIGKLSVDKTGTAEYALKMANHFRKMAGENPCADFAETGGTDFQKRHILLSDDEAEMVI